jgi:hypothetical protein
MLFDQIAATDTRSFPDPYKAEIELLKANVARAQKFVLEPSIARAADGLSRDETVRALAWARPPFEHCWMEVAHAERPKFNVKPVAPGLIRPRRVGLLIEPAPDVGQGIYDFTLVWDCPAGVYGDGASSFNAGEISVCAVSAVVNLGDSSEEWRKALLQLAEPGNPDMGAPHDGPPLPFAFTATRKYSSESITKVVNYDPQLADRMLSMAVGDWGGEPWFWTSVLELLNAKGGAEIAPGEDRTKLNRARAKSGKPELKPFHVLKLKLGAGKSVPQAAPGERDEHRSMRAHMVRGHFKQRASGLYWWSPFVRGDKSRGFADKRYEVKR